MGNSFYGSTGSGEVGVLIWRRGLEVFYWYCIPNRAAESVLGLISVIGEEARVPLGFQQFWFTKRGTQSFEGSGRRRESKG